MKFSRRLVGCLALSLPVPAWAILGVGDVVYDPTSVAETINVLNQVRQEYDRLGSLLGVSTQQFDQLVRLATALGNAGEAAAFTAAATPQQLESVVRSIPGLADADLRALYNTTSQLDAFMGVPIAQWTQAIENPVAFYRSILVSPAVARVANSAGLTPPAIAYLQWFAARSLEDQYNSGPNAAADVSNLLTGDWLQGARQRRINLQGLAAANQDGVTRAGAAQTLIDQGHIRAQLQANTNAILLESAAQATEAREASVRAASTQNQILQVESEERRNADEIRLDVSL